MRGWGKRGPENPDRTEAAKLLDDCAESLVWAFQSLASAGAPKESKVQRVKHIASVAKSCDRLRAEVSKARERFAGCQKRLAERIKEHRAEPHDQAAVTMLEPLVSRISAQVMVLTALLIRFAGSPRRPSDSAERRQGDGYRHCWSDEGPLHRCNWCGKVEEDQYLLHYPLDSDGFVARRKEAVRFACFMCFDAGQDLGFPSPRALPPALPLERDRAPETVECVVVVHPRLPAVSSEDCHGPN